MSMMRTGEEPSVQASIQPAPSPPAERLRVERCWGPRVWLLKRWIRWRSGGDATDAAYRLLRLDDATLSALGLEREAIRRELLHLDEKSDTPESGGDEYGART